MDSQSSGKTTEYEDELARLTLGDMGPLGDTYADYCGQAINVFGGIPGEVVIARIFRLRRRRTISAMVTEVVVPSPHRVTPPCPYFGPCSGCQWQHIAYPFQLSLKQDAVQQQLDRHAELRHVSVLPTRPSPQLFNYRNHARFSVRAQGFLGFSNRITRRFVRIDECMLMDPGINDALDVLQGECRETTSISVRYGVNTGDRLIQPTLHSPEISVASGQTHYRETLLGRSFRVASPSFFQVNTRQAEQLIELVRSRLGLIGSEVLVDAYAGVGTFAALLAPFARRVIAIEESTAAVKDAAVNIVGLDNLEYIEGKTETVLDSLDEKPDAIILDPPRIGCHPATLEAIVRHAPKKVVYVSCDPETLARDLQVLVIGGFQINTVEPLDMFPQTYHVEVVATLESRD